jgi:hypothetical protein
VSPPIKSIPAKLAALSLIVLPGVTGALPPVTVPSLGPSSHTLYDVMFALPETVKRLDSATDWL